MDKLPKYSGWIEIICGPMFSGKTEELIKRITRIKIAKQSFIIIKPKTDFRYSDTFIVSHNNRKIECMIVNKVAEILKAGKNYDVIGIDEVQFFTDEIIDICRKLANSGKRIILSGLDKDYAAMPFGPIPQLMADAEYITKLSSICISCGDLASFSKRITSEKKQVVIGESDKYEARCRRCYYKED